MFVAKFRDKVGKARGTASTYGLPLPKKRDGKWVPYSGVQRCDRVILGAIGQGDVIDIEPGVK